MRIDFAFCIELNRVVDIQDACREFAAQETYHEFHFLCSDPICRNSRSGGVRVTAVNHHRLPEESAVFRSPHFRRLDDHLPTCIWVELELIRHKDAELEDGDSDVIPRQHRILHRKLTRLVTRFIVPNNEHLSTVSREAIDFLNQIRSIQDPEKRRRTLVEYAQGIGTTATNLDALVTCFEELRTENALDIELIVKGIGRISYRDVFRHVSLEPRQGFTVYYGGARLSRRYGAGFLLTFMDNVKERINDGNQSVPIAFYVSPEKLKAYRHSKYFTRIIQEVEKNTERHPYLKVYWIGHLSKRDDGKRYDAAFDSLAHVVMRLVYPQEKIESVLPT